MIENFLDYDEDEARKLINEACDGRQIIKAKDGASATAALRIFKGFSDYLMLKAKGNFILPFCTTPDAIGDKGEELAENLSKAITG